MKANSITLSDFFNSDYPAYGSYDNLRKLPSFIDGFKLSQRKVIYTLLNKYSNPNNQIKTARLASSIAEFTEYVHGEMSLTSVLDNMAASFTGGNNYPLITGHGNFGSRFAGFGSAAAPRYTHCSISQNTLNLFDKNDLNLCPNQIFEGSKIEPTFFVPTFPIIFLNGSEGLSTGWRVQIYPRKLKDITKYISDTINGKKSKNPDEFIPYFKNFKGKTILNSDGVFENFGIISKETNTKLRITEIPIGFDHASYIKVLERLVDNQTISSYNDLSDPKTDTFEFEISVRRVFFDEFKNENDWVDVFRLRKNLNEHLNLIDENNQVKEYNSIKEILDDFIRIRLDYYNKRKNYLIETLTNELILNISRYVWCKGIVDDTIKIRNKSKDNIINQIKKIDKIIKHNDSYNYLLNMPLTSITKEKLNELVELIKNLKDKIEDIKSKTEVDLMNIDLENLKLNE